MDRDRSYLDITCFFQCVIHFSCTVGGDEGGCSSNSSTRQDRPHDDCRAGCSSGTDSNYDYGDSVFTGLLDTVCELRRRVSGAMLALLSPQQGDSRA
jgi:hypothetical protein